VTDTPTHPLPDAIRAQLTVPMLEVPESMWLGLPVLVVCPGRLGARTVKRVQDGLVYFTPPGPPALRWPADKASPAAPPLPIAEVYVDTRAIDGHAAIVAALLPRLMRHPNQVRRYAWTSQPNRRAGGRQWVARGAWTEQWFGTPGADADHQVKGLNKDMTLEQALLHVWEWSKTLPPLGAP